MIKKVKQFKREVQKNIITAVTAAFGFMIALTWRDAIQESVNKVLSILNIQGDAYLYNILVAVLITIICVIGVVVVSRFNTE